jgi:hypothetical protein
MTHHLLDAAFTTAAIWAAFAFVLMLVVGA